MRCHPQLFCGHLVSELHGKVTALKDLSVWLVWLLKIHKSFSFPKKGPAGPTSLLKHPAPAPLADE